MTNEINANIVTTATACQLYMTLWTLYDLGQVPPKQPWDDNPCPGSLLKRAPRRNHQGNVVNRRKAGRKVITYVI